MIWEAVGTAVVLLLAAGFTIAIIDLTIRIHEKDPPKDGSSTRRKD